MTFQLAPTNELTEGEILDMIERDLPGWEWLLRSNFDPRTDTTGSTERYFANLMTPDFTGHVVLIPGKGYVDVSPGCRFPAYGLTRRDALAKAYHAAMEHFHSD